MSSIYNGRSSISKNLCSKSIHKSIKTQLIEHRIEWKAIIITLIEMSGGKRLRLIRLIRKNEESIKKISGSFWQNS